MIESQIQDLDGASKKDRLLSKDYILVMFSSTVHALMNQFFLAAAPLYVLMLGGSTFQASMMATVYSLTALVARPAAGILSDKSGRVKLLIAGALLCAVTCTLIGFIAALPLLLFIRAVSGIGFGFHSTCAGAAVADVLPKSRLAEGIGYFTLYATAALAIGPGIALTIVAGDRVGDYRALFLMTAGLCAASAITNSCITYERKRKKLAPGAGGKPAESGGKGPAAAAPGAVLPKTLLGFEYVVFAPSAVLILLQTGICGISVFMSQFARWRGFGNPGLFYSVIAAGTLISRLFFGKVADKRGFDVIIIPGFAVLAACIAFIPSVGRMSSLVALALPIGIAQGAVLPTMNSMLFKRCSPARRGTASGAYYAAVDLGYVIGAPALGALANVSSYNSIYWASAAFIVLALLLFMLISTDRQFYRKNKFEA